MTKKPSKTTKTVPPRKSGKAMTMVDVEDLINIKLKVFEADLVACKRIQPRAQ